ncbi:helix-turn-helix transcriptional regulator [Diaphorobacter ruginosibacter]|uniref:Helix-turn-helix transcriptional regulator n=1 Tax=Diaphorobacter ruginosibacter TaxID=1715720 RepID=A0A7G9RRI9_9BURK|nr:helix-turn-helix transcriptional regulator [Diaphorobacter ruginosibacter]QNN58214.1 helix-turn-helix transcriptional regulator [Diaphorobacter ruginosibacter]
MPIDITLNVMLARRKVKSKDLAAAIGITEQNLSLLKQGKVKGLRLSTLEAICKYLDCQPGDLLSYSAGDIPDERFSEEEKET